MSPKTILIEINIISEDNNIDHKILLLSQTQPNFNKSTKSIENTAGKAVSSAFIPQHWEISNTTSLNLKDLC